MPFALPSTNVRFCTTSCVPGFVLQSPEPDGYPPCESSHVDMYRMRLDPPPLNVTFPPPSMTTFVVSLKTIAGDESLIVTGSDPQSNVITPPLLTAAMNASAVQL